MEEKLKPKPSFKEQSEAQETSKERDVQDQKKTAVSPSVPLEEEVCYAPWNCFCG